MKFIISILIGAIGYYFLGLWWGIGIFITSLIIFTAISALMLRQFEERLDKETIQCAKCGKKSLGYDRFGKCKRCGLIFCPSCAYKSGTDFYSVNQCPKCHVDLMANWQGGPNILSL